jgi:hypothetical protein
MREQHSRRRMLVARAMRIIWGQFFSAKVSTTLKKIYHGANFFLQSDCMQGQRSRCEILVIGAAYKT